MNLKSYFVEGDNVLAYALVFLVSDRERPIDIRAGSDDTLTILVNGEKVWAHEQYRAASYDDDIVPATLRQGVNTVLLKVCQDWGDWKLIARFTGPGDTPLDGVVLTLAPSP